MAHYLDDHLLIKTATRIALSSALSPEEKIFDTYFDATLQKYVIKNFPVQGTTFEHWMLPHNGTYQLVITPEDGSPETTYNARVYEV